MPDLGNLSTAFQQYVQEGAFDPTLWTLIPPATTAGLFDIIIGGGEVIYQQFTGEPDDPTQWFEWETVTQSPELVAFILREDNYVPPHSPNKIWDWKAILRVFPRVKRPYKVRVEDHPGNVIVPGADFNATFKITHVTRIPIPDTHDFRVIKRSSTFTKGYFVTLL